MGLLRKRTRNTEAEEEGKYLGRTGDTIDLQVTAASGCRFTDARGREHIDFMSGWCVGNLGWNHPAIVERLHSFAGPSYVPPAMRYEPWAELGKQLAEMTPGNLSRSFRAVSGTEAVELALQLAVAATDRTKVVSIEGAYHGNSIAAHSIGEPLDLALHGARHLAPPLDAKALGRLDTLLKNRDVACVIMEPIIMNLAIEVPTDDFMHGLREVCDRYGTLLVFDEVACGFGRTGMLFASEHYNVVPDIMTVAKAITNGHAPLAATITTPEIADGADFDFYSTFGWHPLAVEAALATLEVWRDHGTAILTNVERASAEIVSRLIAMPWKREAQIRAKGLAIAVKLDEDYVSKIVALCRKRGLVIGDDEKYLMMFPPLTIDVADTQEALDILERAVSA